MLETCGQFAVPLPINGSFFTHHLPPLSQPQQDSAHQGGDAVSQVKQPEIRCLSKAEVEKVLYTTKTDTGKWKFILVGSY